MSCKNKSHTINRQRFKSSLFLPRNEKEEKSNFFNNRKTPNFKSDVSNNAITMKKKNKNRIIGFELFHESKWILDKIINKYKTFDEYLSFAYGYKLKYHQVKKDIMKYLIDRKLTDRIQVKYTRKLSCSAHISSVGVSRRMNRPELTRYCLTVAIRKDNVFLSQYGINCLLDHEIGTHFVRAYNEGYQTWYSNREKYGLSKLNSHELRQIEEGWAAIHTVFDSKSQYLGISALLYYSTCMSHFLTFNQLFDHLSKYVTCPDYRWKLCVRLKKGLTTINQFGGYSGDQCYLEGAVYLLSYAQLMDPILLCSGKLTLRDTHRIQRIVRLHHCKFPFFLTYSSSSSSASCPLSATNTQDIQKDPVFRKYRVYLLSIAKTNGIDVIKPNEFNKSPILSVSNYLRINMGQHKCYQTNTNTDHFPHINCNKQI